MFSNCAWKEPPRREYNHKSCFLLTGCWTPCMWYTNMKHASYACAAYTFGLHFLGAFYGIAMLLNDRSAEFYGPFFEFDDTNLLIAVTLFMIYMFLFMIFCFLFWKGLRTDNRFLFWPWIMAMILEMTIMVSYGVWLAAGYWIYYQTVIFVIIVLYIFCAFHIYIFRCVITHYKLLGDDFKVEILYPDYDGWP